VKLHVCASNCASWATGSALDLRPPRGRAERTRCDDKAPNERKADGDTLSCHRLGLALSAGLDEATGVSADRAPIRDASRQGLRFSIHPDQRHDHEEEQEIIGGEDASKQR